MKYEKKHKIVLEELQKNLGNVSRTCKNCKITRKTFYHWKENIPQFKEAVEEIEEENLDWAEDQLRHHIENGNSTPLIFLLKCKGKARGYIEKSEIEISGRDIKIEFGNQELNDNDQ